MAGVAIGIFAIAASLCIPMVPAYYHKYRVLQELDSDTPYRMAAIADHLFLITLSMTLTGLVTAMQWHSLFPGLRDYLVLAGLPVRTRDVFAARFTALIAYIGIFIVALSVPLSATLPWVMSGRYQVSRIWNGLGLFLGMTTGALFVFFALVALQGMLLNIVPPRLFPGISLLAQCSLFTLLICFLPFVVSIPGLDRYMGQRPGFVQWVPTFWFLGFDQRLLGSEEEFVWRLSRSAAWPFRQRR